VLLAAGLIFLWALLLGVWKYHGMATSKKGRAHPYVDTAHRAALLYSFATLLIAVFVELSDWSTAINLVAAFATIGFFVAAIAGYTITGAMQSTDNHFRDPMTKGITPYMWALIATEITGFSVLLAGFASAQIF
jgi:UPF0716 family protein affecting phage T7 exclusion